MPLSIKHFTTALTLAISSIQLSAQTFNNLDISSDEGLEILTWNIEWFPKSGSTTVGYVKDIIEGISADMYAIQEIDDTTVFKNMVNQIDGYHYIMMVWRFGLCLQH